MKPKNSLFSIKKYYPLLWLAAILLAITACTKASTSMSGDGATPKKEPPPAEKPPEAAISPVSGTGNVEYKDRPAAEAGSEQEEEEFAETPTNILGTFLALHEAHKSENEIRIGVAVKTQGTDDKDQNNYTIGATVPKDSGADVKVWYLDQNRAYHALVVVQSSNPQALETTANNLVVIATPQDADPAEPAQTSVVRGSSRAKTALKNDNGDTTPDERHSEPPN